MSAKDEKEAPPAFVFEGFEPANTTPVPDVLFDELLPYLNEAQLKVILYVIRRTLGFKKTADAISLRQFRYGIKTKEGKQLDNGCGLKNMTAIVKALAFLEDFCCIESARAQTEEGDQATTVYRIRFRGGAAQNVGGTTRKGAPPTRNGVPTTRNGVGTTPDVVRGTTRKGAGVLREKEPQETVIQETVIQEGTLPAETSAAEHTPFFEEMEKPNGNRTTNHHYSPGINFGSNDRSAGRHQPETVGYSPGAARSQPDSQKPGDTQPQEGDPLPIANDLATTRAEPPSNIRAFPNQAVRSAIAYAGEQAGAFEQPGSFRQLGTNPAAPALPRHITGALTDESVGRGPKRTALEAPQQDFGQDALFPGSVEKPGHDAPGDSRDGYKKEKGGRQGKGEQTTDAAPQGQGKGGRVRKPTISKAEVETYLTLLDTLAKETGVRATGYGHTGVDHDHVRTLLKNNLREGNEKYVTPASVRKVYVFASTLVEEDGYSWAERGLSIKSFCNNYDTLRQRYIKWWQEQRQQQQPPRIVTEEEAKAKARADIARGQVLGGIHKFSPPDPNAQPIPIRYIGPDRSASPRRARAAE